ncbi:ATP-binding domain-containing protein [Uliginosibacterium sp. sgz301328]|uniref:ATP-binding domain-containing protein n=1 Tax=Uliginosibacterium sp. sgz301328 TaxID=3243764 RepID=UPI00359CC7DE
MARIIPDGWRELTAVGAAAREIETLSLFEKNLPASFTVFHGVHWTRLQQGSLMVGDVDFVVVSPAGDVLLIEQKNGFLREVPANGPGPFDKSTRSLVSNMAQAADALRQRLSRELAPGRSVRIDALLYCPDYTIRDPGTVGVLPERIVDAPRREMLCHAIQQLLPADFESPDAVTKVCRFFSNELSLAPDVRAFVNQADQLYTRLSGGLAHWARQIECMPHRLHVVGTAGSGKTQLALAALEDGVRAGRRVLYVCYNRPLADHIATIVPPEATVATYHHLCSRVTRSLGVTPDYSSADSFDRIGAPFPAEADLSAWQFDELIVDEGQDFEPAWFDNLIRLLRPEGRAWWLEDPMQRLYKRESVALADWVRIRSDTNYRTPGDMLSQITELLGLTHITHSGSPLRSGGMSVKTYTDETGLSEATRRAVTECLGAGFRRDMIAIISFKGRDKSALMALEQLGSNRLKKFTGQYDMLGSPIFSDGELLLETVYRFKGQSCPCVILTEIEFDTTDEISLHKLFVGATRATQKLVLVMSEHSHQALAQHAQHMA